MHRNEDSIIRQETDIASVRTDDVTHGSSYAGNKNVVRREKKNTIETQWALVNDWTSGNERKKEREKWSALLLRRCYNWQWWCSSRRDAISFALSRMSEQKAHSKLDSSCFPLPPLFPPPSTSLAPSFLPSSTSSDSLVSRCCYAFSDQRFKVRNFDENLQFEKAY